MLKFLKTHTVFCAALLLAVLSMFLVPPSFSYVSYLDFRTLELLFCQLLVAAGLVREGFFSVLSERLLRNLSDTRMLAVILVLLCFFLSMLVTNDVSLISFVPFAITAFSAAGHEELLIPVIVLQTIAANLGSMFTPFGNPQNLYLYNLSGLDAAGFFALTWKYTLVAFVLLLICFLRIPSIHFGTVQREAVQTSRTISRKSWLYLGLLLLCILSVLHFLDPRVLILITVSAFFIADRKCFLKVNYMLLLTFVVFFILAGNIREMPVFRHMIETNLKGHEIVVSILTSQVISNVPAAMLLSSFTDRITALIIGTDLGGLGTLVASMASLISYQYYQKTVKAGKFKYLLYFTGMNLIFLAALLLVAYLSGDRI
jgi:Na+/H+ antiporter NhaD/arsenite permease-like protein